jgi:hypothetical protein
MRARTRSKGFQQPQRIISSVAFSLEHKNNKAADSKTSMPAKPSHRNNNLAMDSHNDIAHSSGMMPNKLYTGLCAMMPEALTLEKLQYFNQS